MRALPTLLALAMTVAAPAQAAPTTRDAVAFLRRIYAPFVAKSAMETTRMQEPATIYHPRLLALIAQDAATAKGVPALNGDPLCDCQDWERLKRLRVAARSFGPGRATATVTFLNGERRDRLSFQLEIAGGQWRIADVGTPETPSLADFLRNAIAERAMSSPRPSP